MTIHSTLTKKVDDLSVSVFPTAVDTGQAAARNAFQIIAWAIRDRGHADVILATGDSQLPFFEALRAMPGMDWGKVTFFHMDEYIGLPAGHPASFPAFLHRHFLDHLNPPYGAFFPVPGEGINPEVSFQNQPAVKAYEQLLHDHPADLCVMGIGRTGHLAFNDPPYADFDDPVSVKIVELSEISRKQQVDEGHFPSLADVPTHAVTLTIPALLVAKKVLTIALGQGKAEVVRRTLLEPVTEELPASILRMTPHAHLFLDQDAADLVFPLPE